METIPKVDCQKIGYLQKPHGIKGEVVLQFEPEYEESLDEMPTLFLEIDGLLVPFFIQDEGLRFRSGESALVLFDWIDSEEQARKICGCSVYILKDDLILDNNELGLHMLVGYTLYDSEKGKIGPVVQVDDYAGNLILTVTYNKQEVLVPFSEDFLTRFDEDKKEMELQCPEGIFDL
ncbi:ribosome maturation factor RimM [Mangrovibacterium lignilyticum]|uniref:ribosome maturation factor RimM n=1 Tax=Mangrovibacterium lignilyticum TaxID=2668052 RepID=UPI0013CFBD7F|nr:ribosome maturation factor RimM [Mangrovibacterium lignilyticum]